MIYKHNNCIYSFLAGESYDVSKVKDPEDSEEQDEYDESYTEAPKVEQRKVIKKFIIIDMYSYLIFLIHAFEASRLFPRVIRPRLPLYVYKTFLIS